MGAGAVGGYFGGRLAAAGHDVAFIARGSHLAALRRDGLSIESPLGGAHIAPVTASDAPAEIGPVDLVMFLVKLYDTDAAAAAMAPLIGPETLVVSFQNGVDARERIGAIVGETRVAGGVALISADVKAPGVVRHNSSFAKLVFGAFGGGRPAPLVRLKEMLEGASADSELVPDIERRIWEKFVFLSTFSAITAVTRLPIGPILADPLSADLYRRALGESAAVAQRMAPSVDAQIVDKQMAFAHGMGPGVHASMLDDLRRGKRLELDFLSGKVVALGRELAIPTPVHATVQAALHPYVDGSPA